MKILADVALMFIAVGVAPAGSLGAMEFPAKWALWNLGYGLACGILGLYLLRKLPLTKT